MKKIKVQFHSKSYVTPHMTMLFIISSHTILAGSGEDQQLHDSGDVIELD